MLKLKENILLTLSVLMNLVLFSQSETELDQRVDSKYETIFY